MCIRDRYYVSIVNSRTAVVRDVSFIEVFVFLVMFVYKLNIVSLGQGKAKQTQGFWSTTLGVRLIPSLV